MKKNKIVKKENFFYFLVKPFSLYFKNIYVTLPTLFNLIISSILFFIFFFFFFILFSSKKSDILDNLSSFLLYFLISFIILISLISIISSFFTSSTLVFSRNIVNGIKEKDYLKKSFTYGKYWWKILILWIILGFFLILLFLGALILSILPLGDFSNLTDKIISGKILSILTIILIFIFIGLIFSLFYYPSIYCLVYYDTGIFESIKISFINVYHNFWKFLGLNFFLILIWIIIEVLSLIPFIGILISLIVPLFYIPYSSLVIIFFIKNKFKK